VLYVVIKPPVSVAIKNDTLKCFRHAIQYNTKICNVYNVC